MNGLVALGNQNVEADIHSCIVSRRLSTCRSDRICKEQLQRAAATPTAQAHSTRATARCQSEPAWGQENVRASYCGRTREGGAACDHDKEQSEQGGARCACRDADVVPVVEHWSHDRDQARYLPFNGRHASALRSMRGPARRELGPYLSRVKRGLCADPAQADLARSLARGPLACLRWGRTPLEPLRHSACEPFPKVNLVAIGEMPAK